MNILKSLSLGLVGLFLFANIASAFDVPSHDGFVTDLASVLSDQEKQQLETQIKTTEEATTAEIAVLTIPSLEGADIAQYATAVGQEWGVGKDDRDNGVLILIAVEDRKFFIATGYGVEGILPDIRAKQIGDSNFPVYFRKGDYAGGITAALTDIDGFLRQDESIVSKYKNSPASTDSTGDKEDVMISLTIVASLILMAFLGKWVRKKKEKKGKRALIGALALGIFLFTVIFVSTFVFILSLVISLMAFIVSFFIFIANISNIGGGNWGGGSSGGWGGGSSGGSFGGGSFGGGGGGGSW